MCGRYGLYSRRDRLEALLGLDEGKAHGNLAAHYNIAPSLFSWIVRAPAEGDPVFDSFQWGLLPYWMNDPKGTQRPVNARAETVAEKPMFRRAIRQQRCLVPADGYYEWKTTPAGKRPHWFTMADELPFFFGGIWETWGTGDAAILTFALLTMEPNELCAEVHDRMPVIVDAEDSELWLDPDMKDVGKLDRILKRPFPAEAMQMHEVSTRVNAARDNDPGLIEPLARQPAAAADDA